MHLYHHRRNVRAACEAEGVRRGRLPPDPPPFSKWPGMHARKPRLQLPEELAVLHSRPASESLVAHLSSVVAVTSLPDCSSVTLLHSTARRATQRSRTAGGHGWQNAVHKSIKLPRIS